MGRSEEQAYGAGGTQGGRQTASPPAHPHSAWDRTGPAPSQAGTPPEVQVVCSPVDGDGQDRRTQVTPNLCQPSTCRVARTPGQPALQPAHASQLQGAVTRGRVAWPVPSHRTGEPEARARESGKPEGDRTGQQSTEPRRGHRQRQGGVLEQILQSHEENPAGTPSPSEAVPVDQHPRDSPRHLPRGPGRRWRR